MSKNIEFNDAGIELINSVVEKSKSQNWTWSETLDILNIMNEVFQYNSRVFKALCNAVKSELEFNH